MTTPEKIERLPKWAQAVERQSRLPVGNRTPRLQIWKELTINYPDTKPLPEPSYEPFDIVFSGEGPVLEFVEVETTFGHQGTKIGEWWTDDNGYRRLTIVPGERTGRELWELAEKRIPFSLHFDPQTDPYKASWTIEIGSAAYGGMTPRDATLFVRQELDRGCQCDPCTTTGPHMSDCAVHGVDTEEGIKHLDCTCRHPEWREPVVITERGPDESWLFNLGRFNSEDDIEITPETGKAILTLIAARRDNPNG